MLQSNFRSNQEHVSSVTMELGTANNNNATASHLCPSSKHDPNQSPLVLYVSNASTQPNITYYNAFSNNLSSTQTTIINSNHNNNNYQQQQQQHNNNNIYQQQHQQQQQQQILQQKQKINNNKPVNLFEPYFQNLYDCHKEIDSYVATVTVANTSPSGNVSSSSYFSSPLTPRSLSRCDSVQSSCSSTDSGVDILQHSNQCTPPHLLIQPPQCSPQTLSPHSTQQQQQQIQITDISVPVGWRRLLVNNTIVYISPSGVELSSRETARQYLVTPGTCKCGLECPLHFDAIFSFDPKVSNRAWPPRSEELTKLCNHKRKCMQTGARSSSSLHNDKDSQRRRRRKGNGPYDGMSVSQLLAQRDRLTTQQQLQQHKEMPPRVWEPQHFSPQLRPPCHPLLQGVPPPPQFRPATTIAPPIMEKQTSVPQMYNNQYNTDMANKSYQEHLSKSQRLPSPFTMPAYNPNYNYMQPQQQQIQQPPPPPQQQQQQQQQQQLSINNQQILPQPWNPTLQCYDKDIPNHQISWDDVSKRKKSKSKRIKLNNNRESPCPNVDVRQISNGNRQQFIQTDPNIPSFMEDPNGYLAQQTALLNSTILRQTNVNYQRPPSSLDSSPTLSSSSSSMSSPPNPSLMSINPNNTLQQPNMVPISSSNNLIPYSTTPIQLSVCNTPTSNTLINSLTASPSTSLHNNTSHSNLITRNMTASSLVPSNIVPLPSNVVLPKGMNRLTQNTVMFSQASSVSSTYTHQQLSLPDSASECQACSMNAALQYQTVKDHLSPDDNPVTSSTIQDKTSPIPEVRGPIQGGTISTSEAMSPTSTQQPEVTTMASGHTPCSNTITSVLAGRTNTVTVSNMSPPSVTTTFPSSIHNSKSPLEMVQSVVSSIQVPQQQHQQHHHQQTTTTTRIINDNNSQIQIDQNQLLKTGIQQGHIIVSSNGQLIIQPQKLNNQNTNNTGTTAQMINTVNMGQPLVQLVNTLPCSTPLLLPSMLPQTLTVEGTPLHLTLSGNVLHQPEERTIITNTELMGNNLHHKKKGKKRKSCPQTVSSMLHLQNSPLIMQNFPPIQAQQQPHMLQAVTILPGNKPQFLQFPTNNQQNASQNSPNQQQQFSNFLSTQQNSINLIQPLNLGGFMPNFPLLQGGTTLVVPSLQGLQGMMMTDGTLVSQDPGTVQLQLQNVNGQQVLTQLQGQNMFSSPQNLIATPGMVIRAPAPQAQVISNKITTGQVISQNGQIISPQSQFLVNGAFTQQQLNNLMCNTGQQVTLTQQNTSPNQNRQDFIQCMNVNGQSMIIPCSSNQSVPTSNSNNNAATLLQQNTTIVQQQTTLQVAAAANNQQQNTLNPATTNFLLNNNLLATKSFQDLTPQLLLQKHSVSTQTAAGQTLMIQATATHPPETITVAADTTTASPMSEPVSQTDCVSSTDQDVETFAWATLTEEHVASSTKFNEEKRSGSCKRKHSDLLVIESHSGEAVQEVEETAVPSGPRDLSLGDLVWGPARGFPSWPGKLVQMDPNITSCNSPNDCEPKVWVKWFGDIVPTTTQVNLTLLKTLSEGLEAHHRATKKLRKGRRMNCQLERAIQEAMMELDQQSTATTTNTGGGTNNKQQQQQKSR